MLVIEVGVYKESVKAASSEPWHSAVASDLQSSGHHDCSLLQLVKAFFFLSALHFMCISGVSVVTPVSLTPPLFLHKFKVL